MTNEIELHVGYIGKTRDGKRVEVTEHVPAKNGKDYFVLSNNACVWGDGFMDRRWESCSDIIGPWDEPKLEEPSTYITGQWYGWNGGECPVHPETVVEIVDRDGLAKSSFAKEWRWSYEPDPIIAFRVVTPYVEPKPKLECWVSVYEDGMRWIFDSKSEADNARTDDRVRCVRMIEADDQ